MKAKEELAILSDYLTAKQLIVYLKLSESDKQSYLTQHLSPDQIAEYNVLKDVIDIKTRIINTCPQDRLEYKDSLECVTQ